MTHTHISVPVNWVYFITLHQWNSKIALSENRWWHHSLDLQESRVSTGLSLELSRNMQLKVPNLSQTLAPSGGVGATLIPTPLYAQGVGGVPWLEPSGTWSLQIEWRIKLKSPRWKRSDSPSPTASPSPPPFSSCAWCWGSSPSLPGPRASWAPSSMPVCH